MPMAMRRLAVLEALAMSHLRRKFRQTRNQTAHLRPTKATHHA